MALAKLAGKRGKREAALDTSTAPSGQRTAGQHFTGGSGINVECAGGCSKYFKYIMREYYLRE